MTVPLILFIVLALLLVIVLAWAARPPKQVPLTAEQLLQAMSEERHYARLPQILQSLREEDTEFLRDRGQKSQILRIRQERKRIALRYLDYLEQEFGMLLECSRILATMAPELAIRGEFDRLRESLLFMWNCRYLRLRLHLGLQPWEAFGTLSDMAGTLTLQLEAATARLGEKMLLANPASLPDDGSGQA